MKDNLDTYRNFIDATKKGYLYAQENPLESLEILQPHIPDYDKHIDLKEALEMTIPFFGAEANWGRIKSQNISTFLTWLNEKRLEEKPISTEEVAY